HCVDDLRPELDRFAGELIEAVHGPNDGFAGGASIEMVEAKVVREQVGDPTLEAVELGERVITKRQENAYAKARLGDQVRELQSETALRLVIQEVPLRLVAS